MLIHFSGSEPSPCLCCIQLECSSNSTGSEESDILKSASALPRQMVGLPQSKGLAKLKEKLDKLVKISGNTHTVDLPRSYVETSSSDGESLPSSLLMGSLMVDGPEMKVNMNCKN